ncbi:DUF1294 domain-containing protein [Neisseria perflava]|uniref:DUF1294 domain-containing protein n=1 Tax=Neisseria perflava TaxID=33053 RepID=UPI0020A0AAA4|nr:DUF1294 domain-containing protein [Neisseria perflava]MCP1659915.1 uncharacterized membrane protein YsdA (DUF1294 family)/cold shock CspA family protein [Neisseria perflava]
MTQHKYYGTVVNWFDDMKRCSIRPDNLGKRLFADGQNLSPDYPSPQAGDRVCFFIENHADRLVAYNIAPITEEPPAHYHTTITLTEWDFMQNGGFGTDNHNPERNVFVLGQFLADQGRAPAPGDCLEGNLRQHDNGQWLLVDAVIRAQAPVTLKPEPEEETVQTAQAPAPVEMPVEPAEPHNLLPPHQVMSGTVVNWNDEKGYGFIRFGDQFQTVFFHISAFHYATRRPKTGQKVSFYCNHATSQDSQKAVKVVLQGDECALFNALPPDYDRLNIDMPKFLTNILIAVVFLAAVAYFSVKLAVLYLLFSLISFILYRNDKQIAQKSSKNSGYIGRVPEKNLHLADIIGGWPGALIARAAYNHKTSKTRFIRIFWLSVAINIAITYGLLIHYTDNPLLSLLKN